MFKPLLNHMVIDDLPNYLLPILVRNLNLIPNLYQCLLLKIVDIPLLGMYKDLRPIYLSIVVLKTNAPMALSIII